MLVLRPATSGGVPYWFKGTQHTRWLGKARTALSLPSTPSRRDLTQLLRKEPQHCNQHPADRSGPAGWDLILAAPKSISVLLSSFDELSSDIPSRLLQAWRRSVDDVFGYLEAGTLLRDGKERANCHGLVAAAFEHYASASGDPHLHVHVILANVGISESGDLLPLFATSLWDQRLALGAGFQIALRHQLDASGLGLTWHVRNDGLGEAAEIPGEILRQMSTRSRSVQAEATRFAASVTRRDQIAQGVTRSKSSTELKLTPHERLRNAGWEQENAVEALSSSTSLAKDISEVPLDHPEEVRISFIQEALAEHSSSYTRHEALVATSALVSSKIPLSEAVAIANRVCTDSIRVSDERWTSELAIGLEERSLEFARGGRHSVPNRAKRGQEATDTAELSDDRVILLGNGSFLAQVTYVDLARRSHQKAGGRVALLAPTLMAEHRWKALTALDSSVPGERPDLLIVDCADRLSPKRLTGLLEASSDQKVQVILMEGGSSSRLHIARCSAIDSMASVLPRITPERWNPDGKGKLVEENEAPAIGLVHGARGIAESMASMVHSWSKNPEVTMVAFGPAEVHGLNSLARAHLIDRQALGDTSVEIGRRSYAIGDKVMALHRGAVSAGSLGDVVDIDPEHKKMVVRWEAGAKRELITSRTPGMISHGYATTLPYLRSRPGRLLVLGDPLHLGEHHARVAQAWVACPAPGRAVSWRQTALAHLAQHWPDERILSKVGTRPLDPSQRKRWMAAAALEAIRDERIPVLKRDSPALDRSRTRIGLSI